MIRSANESGNRVRWSLRQRHDAGYHPDEFRTRSPHEAARWHGRRLLEHGVRLDVRARVVDDRVRAAARHRRCRAGDHQAGDPVAHRPARAVPSPARDGAVRARHPVLDRGSRLRHRLPRASPRRAAAGHTAAARRSRQPDHLTAARPPPTAVGALRHRGRRERQVHRAAEQDPPRDHRRRGRRVVAGRAARRGPEQRPRRTSDGVVAGGSAPQRGRDAEPHGTRVRQTAGEDDPPRDPRRAQHGGDDEQPGLGGSR